MSRIIRRRALAWILVAASGAFMMAAIARAEHTHFWRQTSYSDFEKGKADGVAVRSDGMLMAAPRFAQFADPNIAYLWSLRLDSQGRLYAAGGSNARVVRFDAAGKPTTVFESTELVAQDIVLDAKNNLYVATSPDGKIYRVTLDGRKSVFFDPKTRYIWSLAMDARGNLFAGTGDDGKIFVVTPQGDGKLFYQTSEHHARVISFDPRGNLIVGTDPQGLVVRVEMRAGSAGIPEAGKAFVLYETGQREVTALQVDADGTIYAAASGETSSAPPTAAAPPAPAAPQGRQQKSGVSINVTPSSTVSISSFYPISGGGGKLFRITPDGWPEQIWDSPDDFIYSLTTASGGVIAGTGDDGEILRIDGRKYFSRLAKASASQVTGLLAAPDGRIYAASANPGKIFTLGPEISADANFTSEVFDAKIFSRWGRIRWWGESSAAGRVSFYARSGNTSDPDKDWSDWTGPYTDQQGDAVTCPSARFIQWKAVFAGPGEGSTGRAAISWVSMAYQPRNVAPEIDDIVLQQPGVRVQSIPVQLTAGPQQPVLLDFPHGRGAQNLGMMQGVNMHPEIPPQGFRDRGYRSVLWAAHDDNDDDLQYSLFYRREGDKDWTLLKDKLTEKYYSWDSTSMPDGAYYLKIVATDAPSNPPEETLTGERESDRFEVANKPPAVDNLRATATPGTTVLEFIAHASGTILDRAEYSVDSGAWNLLFPVGVLTDSATENYRREISGLAAGEHTVVVRVYDHYGNVTTAQTQFSVPSGKN